MTDILLVIYCMSMHMQNSYSNFLLFVAKMICSQEPRDVFLVVDGSLSIGPTQFEKIRVFVTKLVETLVVNPNMTHFGLLQFSSIRKTRVEFSLDYSHREATLLNRIKYLRYQRGRSTYTGNALKIVEEEVSFIAPRESEITGKDWDFLG